MKKAFNISVEEEMITAFKAKCKESDITMTDVIATLMQEYIDGKILCVKKVTFEAIRPTEEK